MPFRTLSTEIEGCDVEGGNPDEKSVVLCVCFFYVLAAPLIHQAVLAANFAHVRMVLMPFSLTSAWSPCARYLRVVDGLRGGLAVRYDEVWLCPTPAQPFVVYKGASHTA